MKNQELVKLNEKIQTNDWWVFNLLSNKWKLAYLPKNWIIIQSTEAKGASINATIWISLDDEWNPLHLSEIQSKIDLEPKKVFPYSSSWWNVELRKMWKELIKEKNPDLKWNYSLPIITNWLTHWLSIVSHLFISDWDNIITSNYHWENYDLLFENMYWWKFKTYRLFRNENFNTSWFEKSLEEEKGKIIILLNFPNNPTWYSPRESEINKIVEIITKKAKQWNEIVVIIDDAYFWLFYEDDIYKQSIFAKLNNAKENIITIKIDWASKEDYSWGLRVWFITFWWNISEETKKALEEKTIGIIRGTVSNVSNLSQNLLLNTYQNQKSIIEKWKNFNILFERYKKVKLTLLNPEYSKYFYALPCNSWYFISIKIKNLDLELVRNTLINDYSIWVIIYKDIIRIAFSSVSIKKISVLFESIYECCISMKKR